MKKIIKIGTYEFEYKGTISKNYAYNQNYKRLENCYDRPSSAKVKVYNEWFADLFEHSHIVYYGVKSYNAHLIILNAIIELNDKLYYLDIHKSKNEIYELI